jgi:YfiH family protein
VFYRDSQNIYRVRPLQAFDWLVHGFGTRWSESFGSCRNLATLHQIHSDIVVAGGGRSGCLGEGDALLENTPGLVVAVKTADCIPLLMVDPVHRAVAAVHAGWRGTARNIAARAIAEMAGKFDTRPQDLHVAIGPGIGKCCYQVGPEVALEFAEYDAALSNSAQPVHLDLGDINRRQAAACGVNLGQIYLAGICTMCNQEFHSFRRDKDRAGRMLSVVGIA